MLSRSEYEKSHYEINGQQECSDFFCHVVEIVLIIVKILQDYPKSRWMRVNKYSTIDLPQMPECNHIPSPYNASSIENNIKIISCN